MSHVRFRYFAGAESIPPDFVHRIRTDLARSMPRHRVADYLTTKQHILRESDHLVAAETAQGCVGLVAATERDPDDRPFTYVETLLVAEEHHGGTVAFGLVSRLFREITRRRGEFPELVAMKTYTPKAYTVMRRFTVHDDIRCYPSLDGSDPDEVRRLAGRLAAQLSPECRFDPRTGVIVHGGGTVGSDFWQYRPRSGNRRVDAFFSAEVGEFDRVLCLVHAPTPAARAALTAALRITPNPAPRQEIA
ncbi:hypothetical protein [Micromonospora sp.]|uniref:hypothetical protein n=1 Tax=Micromonospora sp. TaxID=1876 RepID=UPI003B3B9904